MAKKKLTIEDMLVPKEEIPYEVPENWCWVKLKGISNLINGDRGKNYPSKNEMVEDGIPFINAGALKDGKIDIESLNYITDSKFEVLNSGKVQKDDTLYCLRGTIGKNAYIEDEMTGAIASSLCIIRVHKDVYSKYVFYLLNSETILTQQNAVNNGTAQPNLSAQSVKDYMIPLPPLAEQVRIVNRIESLFDKVDKASELIDEARDGFEKRRAAILEMAFCGELTKKWREENGVSDEWENNILKDICKITSGGTPSRKNEEYYTGNIPWIKTGEIRWNDIYDSQEHITEEAINNSSAKLIPKNTVLVAMYGQGLTRGRAGILKKSSATNQAVCALIPTEKIDCEFLYYYFMKNYWKFREAAKGGNQENLSGKVIGQFDIELPLLKEQLEIVKLLKKILDEENNIDEITDISETIDIVKKAILAKAFRGELGSNHLDEESSNKLLYKLI